MEKIITKLRQIEMLVTQEFKPVSIEEISTHKRNPLRLHSKDLPPTLFIGGAMVGFEGS